MLPSRASLLHASSAPTVTFANVQNVLASFNIVPLGLCLHSNQHLLCRSHPSSYHVPSAQHAIDQTGGGTSLCDMQKGAAPPKPHIAGARSMSSRRTSCPEQPTRKHRILSAALCLLFMGVCGGECPRARLPCVLALAMASSEALCFDFLSRCPHIILILSFIPKGSGPHVDVSPFLLRSYGLVSFP
jgi:hypothetical protein